MPPVKPPDSADRADRADCPPRKLKLALMLELEDGTTELVHEVGCYLSEGMDARAMIGEAVNRIARMFPPPVMAGKAQ
jgi:hypothetical protein